MNYATMSDEKLVSLSCSNDAEALSVLTARYTEKARLCALSFKNSQIEADDLVQEAMIGFLSAVYSFRNDGAASFSTYASHCIRNRLITVIRSAFSNKHIPAELVVSLEDTVNISENSPSLEEHIISQDEAERISSVVSSLLSKKEKEVFMLYLTGMTYEEIASAVGISQKAVDGSLQRARKKLREKLS